MIPKCKIHTTTDLMWLSKQEKWVCPKCISKAYHDKLAELLLLGSKK